MASSEQLRAPGAGQLPGVYRKERRGGRQPGGCCPPLSVPLRVVEEVAAPIIETPFLTWAVAGSFSGQNVHNSRTPLFPCRPMTGFPSLRRALNLVGSALLVALRAANWCFFSQLP